MLMAVPPLEPYSEGQTDRHPLLMEQPANTNEHEHIIDISRGGSASTSQSHGYDQNDLDELHHEDWPSTSPPALVSETSAVSPTVPNSRNASLTRSDNYGRRRRSPLNSGLWISIELVVNVSQIIAAIIVLSLSRHEHPRAPLFAWIVGYTAGCVATLPHLYWRYIYRNRHSSEQDSANSLQNSSQNIRPESTPYTSISITQPSEGENDHSSAPVSHGQSILTASPRINALVDHFKMALDCFFAVWFVVGNVWIFGGRSSSHDAPNLYGCIGYAMPFILCAMICCCLPCIISIMGFREDMSHNRGATSESINALPTYKFKLKRLQNGDESEINSENQGNGGILAAGTDKERMISAEDAVCCICLANYVNNDELRELPCTHHFHMECVDKWLKINALCPLCKSEVGSSTDSSGTDSGYHHGDRRVGNSAEPQQGLQ
uniref:E3 ubiquitin-protein ligase At1g12760-like isoform X2 n=1 Tax=Elaeis guineensis var. tenera TaxID=51953 RepID=A0A8N4F489_ELAGV|nr:E3 ubiquitin-protein ligase At1g12760-like isoform X2 [Elaeis guineensis]